jgi:hypothetical protein
LKADIAGQIGKTDAQVKIQTNEVNWLQAQANYAISALEAHIKGQTARVDGQVRVQSNEIAVLQAKGMYALDSLKAQIQVLMQQKDLTIGSMRTLAQLEASVAQAFASIVNYSAGISASQHYGLSDSNSFSYSKNVSVTADA